MKTGKRVNWLSDFTTVASLGNPEKATKNYESGIGDCQVIGAGEGNRTLV
ncbi:MAG: hypothetical protein Q8R69_14405 [Telluria sp.]|nr:hypothetical protein [Telluria sp.]